MKLKIKTNRAESQWGPQQCQDAFRETLTSNDGDLSRGQAQNGLHFEFWVQFDLGGHGQSPHKTIGILTKIFKPLIQIRWS